MFSSVTNTEYEIITPKTQKNGRQNKDPFYFNQKLAKIEGGMAFVAACI